MAASMSRATSGLKSLRLWNIVGSQYIGSVVVVPVRHKLSQGSRRVRAPHVPKDKEKKFLTKTKFVQVTKERKVSEEWLFKKPEDDIWIRNYYPTPKFPIRECILRHKEYADPSMLDNMEGFIYANLELDMSTKKKTKFRTDFQMTVKVPHWFDHGSPNTCIVFCKSEEDQEKAVSMGALHAGGTDLIRMIQDGLVDKEAFDFVLCTPDMIQEILPLRPLMRTKFPNVPAGTLGTNVESMMTHFTKGITFHTTKKSESVSKLQVPFGKLYMEIEHLEENLQCLTNDINKERPKNLPGSMIQYIDIVAPPSPEVFIVNMETVKTSDKVEKKAEPVEKEKEGADIDSDSETTTDSR